jgi:hypothetical protein
VERSTTPTGSRAASEGRREGSGWAAGGVIFAGSMMILIGFFQMIAGFVAIIDDEFFVVRPNYTFELDVSGWGWIHLAIGILLILLALGVLTGRTFARWVAVGLVGLSALANFFFIPYYPVWSIVVIAIDVFVIWALTRPEYEAV